MRKSINPKVFIKVWQESSRITEVAEKLGISRQCVQQKGNQFRQHGVPLKRLKNKLKLDWPALSDYAKEIDPGV